MEKNKEIAVFQKEDKTVLLQAKKFKIEKQADSDKAKIILMELKIALDKREKKRLSYTKPLNESLTEINKDFNEIKHPIIEAINDIKQKVLDWRKKESERIRLEDEAIEKEEERRRNIQASHKEKGHKTTELPELEKAVTLKETDSTNTMKVWKWNITDLSKVKKKYAVALKKDIMELEQKDLPELNKVIRDDIKKGITETPGFNVYQKESIKIF